MSRFAYVLLMCLMGLPSLVAAEGLNHAFLIQNSGWMEPFYTDPSSQFKPLVGAVVKAVATEQDKVFISAFNQSTPSNPSPQVLYEGFGPGNPAAVLSRLEVAKKAPNGALADTDFREAVTRTIVDSFKADPGILWIITNNKNSPNNDLQTAARNREFYQLVHLEPSITRSVAFPLMMPVTGRHYNATGLMVYALAYGDPAAMRLKELVEEGHLSRVFTRPPARLKPLDQDSVRIIPQEVRNSKNVKVSLGSDGSTIILDILASDIEPKVSLRAVLENLLSPYEIIAADVSANMIGEDGSVRPVTVTPVHIVNLPAGGTHEVEVQLPMPLAQIPPPWSVKAFSAMGKEIRILIEVEVALLNQQLDIPGEFLDIMSGLFPGDPLPEVFSPPSSVQSSTVRIPFLLRIQYPLLPVIVVIGLLLLLVAGGVGLIAMAGQTSRFSIAVDGELRSVALKPFSSVDIRCLNGDPVGTLKRGIGRPQLVQTVQGHTIEVMKS